MKNLISNNKIFTGNILKIIALICMTFDHVGKEFFPNLLWMQIIGRIAFPVFGFMIAEGCRYTRNRIKYLFTLGIMALFMQIIYYIFEKNLYMCIFVTFTLSVCLIYAIDNFKRNKNFMNFCLTFFVFGGIFYLTKILPQTTTFWVDYGFFGVMLPVVIYYSNKKIIKLTLFTFMLLFISFDLGGMQIYSLLSVVLIILYNGKRGKMNLKYLFYVYYPLHLAVIYLMR